MVTGNMHQFFNGEEDVDEFLKNLEQTMIISHQDLETYSSLRDQLMLTTLQRRLIG